MRLLQLLGLWYERGNVLVFVDKQEKCDSLFQDLLKYGYVSVTLHGGKDQLDRDHTIHEFKTKEKTLMIATSVAGRGLDVPDLVCVINYNCPNHLEEYVHRVGRTGRAGRKGTAYTFISPSEEMYAPMLVKALQQAKQEVPQALIDMANEFKAKVHSIAFFETISTTQQNACTGILIADWLVLLLLFLLRRLSVERRGGRPVDSSARDSRSTRTRKPRLRSLWTPSGSNISSLRESSTPTKRGKWTSLKRTCLCCPPRHLTWSIV
jgi:superfamily II DNA/RNA helicase